MGMVRGGRRAASAAALVATLGGCALVRSPAPRPAPPPVIAGVETGIASWYGPGFHGRRTASGEIFDQHDLTAAHRSLRLGTRVMVTNLDNERTIEVRINDRGPFVDGRVIDLSYAAARAVDMIGPGTARVRLEMLGAAPVVARRLALAPPAAPRNTSPEAAYAVEVAALRDAGRAQHLRGVLAHRFPEAFVAHEPAAAGDFWRVRLGPYPHRTLAVASAERAVRLGYPAVIVETVTP